MRQSISSKRKKISKRRSTTLGHSTGKHFDSQNVEPIEILNIERECSEILATKPLPLFQLMKLFHSTVYLVTFDGRFLKDNAF